MPESKLLWHGTKHTDPRLITSTERGFNTQYAKDVLDEKDGAYWGRAVYFAADAKYSCLYYCHQEAADKDKCVILAKVIVDKP